MGYKIRYEGYADRDKISIISSVDGSGLQNGLDFTIRFLDNIELLNKMNVYISQETINTYGYLIWTENDKINYTRNGDSITVKLNRASFLEKSFIKIIFNGLTLREKIRIEITSTNEGFLKTFLKQDALMLSNSISRNVIYTSSSYTREVISTPTISKNTKKGGIYIKGIGEEDSGISSNFNNYIVSKIGKNGRVGSDLKWFLTSHDKYLSTTCSVKNLSDESCELRYCIQGLIDDTFKGPQWRIPCNEEKEGNRGLNYASINVGPGQTATLDYQVYNFGTVEAPKAKIDCTGSFAELPFSQLFWRIDVWFGSPERTFLFINNGETNNPDMDLNSVFSESQVVNEKIEISQEILINEVN